MRTIGKDAMVAVAAVLVAATIFLLVSHYNAGAMERKYREEIRQLRMVKEHDSLQVECMKLQAEIDKFQEASPLREEASPLREGASPLREGAPAPAAADKP